jgi:hypothetical protein
VINGTTFSETTEDCSVTRELISTWPVIIGIICLVLLFILAVIFFICFCRIKAKYSRLLEENDDEPQQARQIEMS